MGWLRDKLSLVESNPHPRPTRHEDFEMAVRVDEALAAAAASARIVAAQKEEAAKLFGTIRREIKNTKAAGEAT